MSESTGFYASTIHKAIGWSTEDENMEEFVSEKYIKNHIINQLEGGKDSFKHKMSIYETALSE